jgi:hypothetical protein
MAFLRKSVPFDPCNVGQSMNNISKRVSKGEKGWFTKVPITSCPDGERRRRSVDVFDQRLNWNRPGRMWLNIRDFWGFARNSRG